MAEFKKNIEKCILRSRNYKFRDVLLPNKTAVVIGRGPQTKIRERRCSKTQVEIIADYSRFKASVKQLGSNPSEIGGKLLCLTQSVDICDGCSINLLEDDLKFTLEFIKSGETVNDQNSHSAECSNLVKVQSSEAPVKREAECGESSNKKPKYYEEEKKDEKSISSQLNCIRESLVNDLESLTTEDSWEEYDHSKLLMYNPVGLKPQTKVAAFDMDHTIICTKSGKVFPVDTYDWQILYSEIPGKLKDLHQKGYKIVIFTNQKGISRGHTYVPDFKKKIQSIVKRLGVPVQVFVSTGVGKYRKPNIGMWEYFELKGNHGISIDKNTSMYIGDAAGRVDKWAPKKKKDFSCADRLFALNLGVKFHTPEEFFLQQKPAQFTMPSFDPRNIGDSPLAIKYLPLPTAAITESEMTKLSVEVIIFVGYPASGKSHFAKRFLISKGYVHVNRDILGTWQKCVTECSKSINQGRRVVIDNTNPDPESRARYIEIAKRANVPCRCFLFTCSIDQAKHNNWFRQLQMPDDKHVGVNDMVFNSYKGKYKEPVLREGFSEIIKINFVPHFKNVQDEKMYKVFLIAK